MEVCLIGDTRQLQAGLTHLIKAGQLSLSSEGFPIHLKRTDHDLRYSKTKRFGTIHYKEEIHFFRGLSLWLALAPKNETFNEVEVPQFKTNGVMIDASRNAVPKVKTLTTIINKMASMGLNLLMLYTEDTYEVPEYPYFGYLRGRYSQQELSFIDNYAASFGIEVVPCIQTLGHLTNALQWNYARKFKDTDDLLLVNSPETDEFLKNILTQVSQTFRSRRIHIGMDEAHQLGLGQFLQTQGYQEPFKIMTSHLNNVLKITKSLDLQPMIWSDMFFRTLSQKGDYYEITEAITPEFVAEIPKIDLVYWDYYHQGEADYRLLIERHQQLKQNFLFAGGIWTFNGIAPNYGKTLTTTKTAFQACKKAGVQEVFTTIWLDDGAETPLLTALPGMQLVAEESYQQQPSLETVSHHFASHTKTALADFLLLNQFDETPGVTLNNPHASAPSKFLLWQDPLLGLYDQTIAGLALNQHYQQLTNKLVKVSEALPQSEKSLFEFYYQLALVLSQKAELGLNIMNAYTNNDQSLMATQLETVKSLQRTVAELRLRHRQLWFSDYKAFGWEVLDIRYGGLLTRLDTTRFKLENWLAGDRIISELEEIKLEHDGFGSGQSGHLGRNLYQQIVSPSKLSGV